MTLARDWADPGHDLPKPKHYRNLDAFLDSDGIVRVGNRAIEVVPADTYRGALAAMATLERALTDALSGDPMRVMRAGRVLQIFEEQEAA